jgi:hypothetical protein
VKFACEVLVATGLALHFLAGLWRAVNGQDEIKASGFWGVIAVVLFCLAQGACYWKAGAFSEFAP